MNEAVRRWPAPASSPAADVRVILPLTPAQVTLAEAMPEATLEGLVAGLTVKVHRSVLRYHTRDSRGSPEGFLDDVLAGPRGLLVRELKSERGSLTRAQTAWLDRLAALGLDVDVWRPRDWFSERIQQEVQAIA